MLHLMFLLWAAFWCWWFSPIVMLIASLSRSVFSVMVPGGVTCVAATEASVFVVTVLVLIGTRVATSGGAVVAWPALCLSSLLTVVGA